jgi:uncharacterized BrkB/YihY/UPF0761 family membrane protein
MTRKKHVILSAILLPIIFTGVMYLYINADHLNSRFVGIVLTVCAWALALFLTYFLISFVYWAVPAKWWHRFRGDV